MITVKNVGIARSTGEILKKSHLFSNFTIEEIETLLADIPLQHITLEAGDTLYSPYQSDPSTGFLVQGSLKQFVKLHSGSIVQLANINPVEMVDAQSVFNKGDTGPAYLTATSPSKVLFITKANLSRLFNKDKRLLYYYMEIVSGQAFRMTEQLEHASFLSLQKRVGLYLQSAIRKQLSDEVRIPHTIQDWAEQFHTTHEALLRTLEKMEEEGIILISDQYVQVLAPDRL
jgi:CRP-like cAMP-binding protein